MKPIALLVLLAYPILSSAQQERAADARVAEVPGTGPSVLVSAPAPLALAAPSLAAAAPSAAPLAILPAAPAAAAALPLLPAGVPAESPRAAPALPPANAASTPAQGPARDARGALRSAARPTVAGADSGRTSFDGGLENREGAAVAAGAGSAGTTRLAPATERAPSPAASMPLRQRAGETAELGALALGFQLLTGIAFLMLGAHASFPALAGAFWALAGTEMIKQLGKLRGFVVGGWQASHDQKMRHDYGTGQLKDIRGHKYGEDRYDIWAPGRVSSRGRRAIDATAFLLGLPWVVPAGPKAVALYAVGAAAAFAARALWRRRSPEPAPVDARPDFEPDR